jgi:hypothetical protein
MMFGTKTKTTEPPFPRHELGDRISHLVTAAGRAGCTPYEVAEQLEHQASAIRTGIAVTAPSDRSIF